MTHEQIESIKVMQLQPGDVVVLKVKDRLSRQQREAIHEAMRPLIPDGIKCAVLDGGMDIEVLRHGAQDA